MAKRINPLAPYFVQMRELERRLLNSTLEQASALGAELVDRVNTAANLLGVQPEYIRVRAQVLGGVLDGEPKCEPPTTTATQAWGKVARGHPRIRVRKTKAPEKETPDA